ncbi:MAG: DUF2357 domain-containing protein [Syntrophomonadaceae bacterium]|jgi:hypothetical protein
MLEVLFELRTDRVELRFSKSSKKVAAVLPGGENIPGRLAISQERPGLIWEKIWRQGIPSDIACFSDQIVGPRLFEETDYKLYATCKNSESQVRIVHRDPALLRDLDSGDHGKSVFGHINFRSQVGRTKFRVLVDEVPEFDFEVEVFPTKLDYSSDYEKMLADVQDIMTGLAMEYLKSTYQLGTKMELKRPTDIEWLVLLKNVVGDLENALLYIARRPIRGLKREVETVRIERIKHVDATVRSAIRCGTGKGAFMALNNGIAVRQQINEKRPQPTLNTVEHKWLAGQLNRIRQRLNRLRVEETALWQTGKEKQTERRQQTIKELEVLESKILFMQKLEPLASTEGEAPVGFASMQLLGSPGYKEAYQACIVLSLGLRIEDGPMQLSIKDINLLYEYWCYLALLRILSEETGQAIPAHELIKVRTNGLQVLLQKGRKTQIPFARPGGRKIIVSYNPSFSGKAMLIPQQPDILLTLQDNDWPLFHLVLDAKYRLDASEKYYNHYNSFGPPEDAINIMHRYRDAILELDNEDAEPNAVRRTVIQAVALFPCQEQAQSFKESKLWQSLNRIGIGALPFLPDNMEYLREWLRGVLQEGGFTSSRRAIPYKIQHRAQDWRTAATEVVLVGVLRGTNAIQHLNWIIENRLYYMPLLKSQLRQYTAKWVAIYSPLAIRKPGAVTHKAEVLGLEIVQRKAIDTPWHSNRAGNDFQVLYRLGEITKLEHPVENLNSEDQGRRFSSHRWTTRLALDRAKRLEELFLETEPEWRLFEDLNAMGISFQLNPGPVKLIDPENPSGRVWFELDNCSIRYAGLSGYAIKRQGKTSYFKDYNELVADLSSTEM